MNGDSSGTGTGTALDQRDNAIEDGNKERRQALVPASRPGGGQKGQGKGSGKGKGKNKLGKARKKALRQAARAQHGSQAVQSAGQQGGAFSGDMPEVVQVHPIARPARMKTRHWGLVFSFFLLVLAPLCGIVFYLWTYANDQYISTTGFTVRSQETSSANDLLGGLAQFAGGTVASDSDILYEFIQSQEMVEAVNREVDLRAHYTSVWPDDWVFGLWPDSTMEDLVWYWHRIVGISYDSGTGLMEVTALAFDPDVAQSITRAILRESQDRINELNVQAREDALRYALADLQEAQADLKAAREALTSFRTRTRIVDPEADIQGRMGVMNNLQQQLAEALIEYDLLRTTSNPTDPRLTKAQQRIDVIRERIQIERQTFASNNTDTGAVGEDYPTLIAEFERLSVDREYAELTYTSALTALSSARDDAARQSRYLATYISPTRAEEAEYPQRFVLSALAGLFLLLSWAILSLIYYSIRDRS
jgi:capsular polysaccharide transport system permease protein